MRSSRGSLSSRLVEKHVEMGVQSCRPLSSGHRVSSCASSKVLSQIFCVSYTCSAKSSELGSFVSIVGQLRD
jgi:hypothetical protein